MSNVATLAGHVTVEDHAVIGGLAAVHQFCRIGTMAMIGGCSKVVQDVPPFMMADGNPAETRTINKTGMERNGVSEEAQGALRQAYKILFREGLTVSNAIARVEARNAAFAGSPAPDSICPRERTRHQQITSANNIANLPRGWLNVQPALGWVAQLVEQRTENPCVGGSIPPPATNFNQ